MLPHEKPITTKKYFKESEVYVNVFITCREIQLMKGNTLYMSNAPLPKVIHQK